jgi:hypothetical protein
MGLLDSLLGADSLVRGVHVESNLLPPITIPLGGSGDGGDGGGFDPVSLLKPRVTVDLATGPLVIAPAGAPTPERWKWVLGGAAIVGLGVLALATYGAVRLVRG